MGLGGLSFVTDQYYNKKLLCAETDRLICCRSKKQGL